MAQKHADKIRCFGGKPGQELYAAYHDEEWGVPVYDDKVLFEMLCLEGAQAGWSWETVLKKRAGYRAAYHGFDIDKIIAMTDEALEALRYDDGIVKNRLKIYSVRKNAFIFRQIQQEFDSFSNYLWGFVDGKPILNRWEDHQQVPANTSLSDAISKDLKNRGMSFVGSTIIYAYLQGVGVVNDHITSCWCFDKNR